MQLSDASATGDFILYANSEFLNRWGAGVVAAVATSAKNPNLRDSAHTLSMLRSPIFVVGDSPCTVVASAMGGSNRAHDYVTASSNWLGLLWRDASAAQGTYLGGVYKSDNYQNYGANAWRDISMTISTPGTYTVDAADFFSGGGYGWVAFREVTFSAGCSVQTAVNHG